jgi:hypothetical protein
MWAENRRCTSTEAGEGDVRGQRSCRRRRARGQGLPKSTSSCLLSQGLAATSSALAGPLDIGRADPNVDVHQGQPLLRPQRHGGAGDVGGESALHQHGGRRR